MLNLDRAIELLNQDQVVAFPTETVYGLGARIDSETALKKIFSTKNRPFFDPLIVHVSSLSQAQSCFQSWGPLAAELAKKFWPGPLTLVMTKSEKISDLITSGLPSVGVRWPKHKLAEELIRKVGVPLAAPSANQFGKTSPTTAEHVKKEFHNKVPVLESTEACEVGIESTVLLIKETNEISILRKGYILKSDIDQVLINADLKYTWMESVGKKESPGHMKHHYMPEIPFVICRNPSLTVVGLVQKVNEQLQKLPDQIEGITIIKPARPISKVEFLKLSARPEQAAREVYSQLRAASERKPDLLCFIQMPNHSSEMWESVFDRLYKAASLVID